MIDSEELRNFLGSSMRLPQCVINEFCKLSFAYAFAEQKFWKGNAENSKVCDYADDFIRNTNIDPSPWFNDFKTRYVMEPEGLHRLQKLANRRNHQSMGVSERRILSLLQMTNPTSNQKVEAILRIVFRLRNNALHGNKSPYLNDEDQARVMGVANSFLSNYLCSRADD